jgi:predicted transcriptional regulator
MKLPCEVVVWYLVPVIKSELAKELVSRGVAQKEVAKIIDVTQAAVSQYVSKKRGNRSILTKEMKADIKSFADKVIDEKAGKKDLQKLICRECMKAREIGLVRRLSS